MKLIAPEDLKPKKGICLSRSQLWRKARAGSFPRPVKIGDNRTAYVEAEIDRWIAERIAERDSAAIVPGSDAPQERADRHAKGPDAPALEHRDDRPN